MNKEKIIEKVKKAYKGALIKEKGFFEPNMTARVYKSEFQKKPTNVVFLRDSKPVVVIREESLIQARENLDRTYGITYHPIAEYYEFSKNHLFFYDPETEVEFNESGLTKEDMIMEKSPITNEEIIRISRKLDELGIKHKLKISIEQ